MAAQWMTDLQTSLRNARLYSGPITGDWNTQTTDALRAFQTSQGLTPTGDYDLATQARLRDIGRALFKQGPLYSDADVQKAFERYGPALAAYVNHPELGPIIIDAARTGKDLNWLNGQLQKTAYFRSTAAANRAWNERKITDPTGARQTLDQKIAEIKDMALTLGLTDLSPGDLAHLANDAISFEWDDTILRDMVVGAFASHRPPGAEPAGDIGTFMGSVKERAADQLLPLSDEMALQVALKMARGETNLEAVETLFRAQAKAKAPHLAALIDDGISLSTIFEPHRQRIGQMLEIAPDAVDFVNDNRWANIVNYADPDQGGKIRMMTEQEAAREARKTTDWQTTSNANEAAGTLYDKLTTTWGIRG